MVASTVAVVMAVSGLSAHAVITKLFSMHGDFMSALQQIVNFILHQPGDAPFTSAVTRDCFAPGTTGPLSLVARNGWDELVSEEEALDVHGTLLRHVLSNPDYHTTFADIQRWILNQSHLVSYTTDADDWPEADGSVLQEGEAHIEFVTEYILEKAVQLHPAAYVIRHEVRGDFEVGPTGEIRCTMDGVSIPLVHTSKKWLSPRAHSVCFKSNSLSDSAGWSLVLKKYTHVNLPYESSADLHQALSEKPDHFVMRVPGHPPHPLKQIKKSLVWGDVSVATMNGLTVSVAPNGTAEYHGGCAYVEHRPLPSPQGTGFTTARALVKDFVRRNASYIIHCHGKQYPVANINFDRADASVVMVGAVGLGLAAFHPSGVSRHRDDMWLERIPLDTAPTHYDSQLIERIIKLVKEAGYDEFSMSLNPGGGITPFVVNWDFEHNQQGNVVWCEPLW